MEKFTNLVIQNFPNYKELAKEAFERNYNHQWERPMYQGNASFERLREKYGIMPLTRQMIIDLFKAKHYYEGFLCAMVWGNIGTYQNGRQRFESVFDDNNKEIICLRLERVIDLLENGDLNTAYSSLLDSNQENGNAISGVGESFFTKLLYFAGANCDCLAIKPLIFDNNIKIFYRRLLNMLNEGSPRGALNRYIDYCSKMDVAARLLGLQHSGYVEALLFRPDLRAFISTLI